MRDLRTAIDAFSTGPSRRPDSGTLEQQFRFGPDFEGFAGHFPGHPLLPAFVQVLVISALARILAPESGALSRVDKAKFLREIRPGEEIIARCRKFEVRGCPAFEGTLDGPEGRAASMTLLFEEQRKISP